MALSGYFQRPIAIQSKLSVVDVDSTPVVISKAYNVNFDFAPIADITHLAVVVVL